MKVVNLATSPVTVAATAGGTVIFTSAQATQAALDGLEYIGIFPVSTITIVDSRGLLCEVPGTAANSPFDCPAGKLTMVKHRSGEVRAITASGTSVTRIAAACAP